MTPRSGGRSGVISGGRESRQAVAPDRTRLVVTLAGQGARMRWLMILGGRAGWALIVGCLCIASPIEASQSGRSAEASGRRVEDIYIARSMRESRVAAGDFCAEARTGFGSPRFEDRYTLRSTATRSSDGLMVDANVQTIGSLRACFGSTPDQTLSTFYAEGALGAVTFTGRGECRSVRQDFPEPGMTVYRCFLELSDLPGGYVGGQLTTNTMGSRNALGDETDPPGYTQPSIATIRVWRRR